MSQFSWDYQPPVDLTLPPKVALTHLDKPDFFDSILKSEFGSDYSVGKSKTAKTSLVMVSNLLGLLPEAATNQDRCA